MDTYELRGAHIGPQTIVEITGDRHAALVEARHYLIDAGNFERRYELMMGNFLAFEEFCAVSHLRNEMRMDWGYESGDALIMEANRHIINVFTSGKTYVDQVVRDFKFFGESGAFANKVRELASAAYDGAFDYRMTCQLRDRAQHRALPVDGYDGAKDEIGFYAAKAKITADRGTFKNSILDESPDKIYLRTTLRGYMQKLSGIHVALRRLVQPEVDSSRALISAAITEYGQAQNAQRQVSSTGIGLESVHYRDLAAVGAVPLLLNWDDNRIRLAEKNRYMISFAPNSLA